MYRCSVYSSDARWKADKCGFLAFGSSAFVEGACLKYGVMVL